MKFNKYLICALFLVLICCIGAASAADSDDVVAANDTIDEAVSEAVDVSDEVVDDSLGVSEEPALSDGEGTDLNEVVIYVGTNENDGDGSPENPFSTLMLARNKIAETNTKNAIINIYDGEYEVPRNNPNQGTPFTFGTDNLIINGIGKNVSFVPFRTDVTCSFVLTTTSANFTMNNIIFNSAAGLTKAITGDNKFFKPVSGNVNAKITNCTFLGNQYTQLPRCIDFNTSYIGCIFKDFTSDYLIYSGISESSNFIYFEDCIFSNLNVTRISSSVDKNKINVTFNGIWIGQNTLPTYAVNSNNQYANGVWDIFTYGPINDMDYTYSLPVKYAIFSVSENYLSGNQYEIVGRLTWNGTDNSEGMENFPPMTVTLTSATGEIQNATLVNGTFKAIYNSDSSEHKVSAKLDSEEKNLTFSNIALNLNAPTLNYGGNQNIVVNLSKPVTGIVTVTVNSKNYPINIDNSNSITVSIDEVLTVGTHDVNVTFIDEENHIYGSNATTITISSINTKITALNVSTTYNVTKDLVVTLTDAKGGVLANKTVNIVVGTINKNLNTNEDGQISIDISTLAPDTYIANIIFGGDEIYAESSTTATVIVKADIKTNITIPEITAGKATTTTIKLPENATGNITVTIDGKVASVVNLTNGSAIITIPELSAGKHDVVISYSGDGNYAAFSQNSTVTVKEPAKPTPTPAPVKKAKQATKIVAKNKKFKAKTKVKKYTITLKTKAGKAVKKVQVTIKIGKKTYKAKTNAKGKATFKIKKLTKKAKYTATIKFKGNKNYKASTKKVKITIKK